MPSTPDRFPGERLEESLLFEDRVIADEPIEPGQQRYVQGQHRAVDGLGVSYPLRNAYAVRSPDRDEVVPSGSTLIQRDLVIPSGVNITIEDSGELFLT